ncbi:hypothetical protein DY000_02041892 [Brassica cretica]|uniref:Uncharacterized protein n=1 Tax=Brassica cretica TaxID=69181 RepID=A0ABQ7B754_BRACR|nr:hypothetical protein DY000_02041892 [Brassica cretica]
MFGDLDLLLAADCARIWVRSEIRDRRKVYRVAASPSSLFRVKGGCEVHHRGPLFLRSEENNHGVPLGEPLVSFLFSMLTPRWRRLGFTFFSSAVLVCVRLSASSSSNGALKQGPAVSIDACLSHLGECLTELTSSYSLDGLANPS